MARELRELAGYFLLSLLLIGSAELAVAFLAVPRLWALLITFTVGYAVVAVVKWRSRTEHTAPEDDVRAGGSAAGTNSPPGPATSSDR